jgi:Xaa-Pro aminopeptidase
MSAITKVREKMEKTGLPALLVSNVENAGWMTGFSGSSANVVVTPKDALFITDSRYTIQAREEVSEIPVETYASPVEMSDFVAQQLKKMGVNKIGFEASSTTFDQYEKLKGKLSGIELIPAAEFFTDLRLIKSEEEIERTRAACRLADKCFEHVLRMIQPGVSEWDIGLEIEFFFRRNLAEVGFSPIVASGWRSALPHGRASETKKLEAGDFVTLDFGGKLDGYNSDITRTVVLSPCSDRHKFIYEKVLASQLAALNFMKPGVTAHDCDAAARDLLAKDDLAKYFGHGLGHGLGRSVHDGGRLGTNSKTILAPGQIWTVEPGVYIEGFGGVRIEDDVVVTETGIEILTKSTKELLVL